jgi:GTPase SAR1 family protein
MPTDFTKIKPTQKILPPRIIIYGPPKIGKTAFAASIPDNILLDYEGGSGFAKVSRIEKSEVDTFAKTMDCFQQLSEQKHSFKAVTIDTADWLEAVVNEEAARQHEAKSVGDVPYGAGFVTAQNIFKTQILEALDYLRQEKGMMIVLLAHECIRRYDNPTTQSYDRYTLKLQENTKGAGICALLKEWTDAILFVNQETYVSAEQVTSNKKGPTVKKARTSNNVILHTQESPAFLAGNRFNLPPQLPFSWPDVEKALSNALTQKAA